MNKPICCNCYDPELDKLIYEIKFALNKLSDEIVKAKCYGFSCDKHAEEKVERLSSYQGALEREYQLISLGGTPCLDCGALESFVAKIKPLTASCDLDCRIDYSSDDSNELVWIAANPNCVSKERYEGLVCETLDLCKLELKVKEILPEPCSVSIEVTEQECNLAFEITKNIIPCDVMVAVSAYSAACKLEYEVKRTEIECDLDYSILIEKVEDCSISLSVYKRLVSCNLTYDIIKTVLDNNCTFEIDDATPMLVTPMSKYRLDSFDFRGVPDVGALSKYGVNTTDSEYAKNPIEFIKKLNSDYSE